MKRDPDPHILLRKVLHLAKQYSDQQLNILREEMKNNPAEVAAILTDDPLPPQEIPMDEIAQYVISQLPKKGKRKKSKGVDSVTLDQVSELINRELQKAEDRFTKTGETIMIQQAPQTIVEKIREVVKVENTPIDYTSIEQYLEQRMAAYYQTVRAHGAARSLRLLSDVDLTGVPQDSHGNYLLGQMAGGGIELVATDPVDAEEGDQIINTSTHELKVFYLGTWQVIHTFTPPSGVGIGYWIIGTDFVVS